ncbi:Hypothetical protein D9617_5g068330 [Elsinoe fawcettii]|nr:Hypothetical protein D9617_5g068330 [Elsinoe fawcettii]
MDHYSQEADLTSPKRLFPDRPASPDSPDSLAGPARQLHPRANFHDLFAGPKTLISPTGKGKRKRSPVTISDDSSTEVEDEDVDGDDGSDTDMLCVSPHEETKRPSKKIRRIQSELIGAGSQATLRKDDEPSVAGSQGSPENNSEATADGGCESAWPYATEETMTGADVIREDEAVIMPKTNGADGDDGDTDVSSWPDEIPAERPPMIWWRKEGSPELGTDWYNIPAKGGYIDSVAKKKPTQAHETDAHVDDFLDAAPSAKDEMIDEDNQAIEEGRELVKSFLSRYLQTVTGVGMQEDLNLVKPVGNGGRDVSMPGSPRRFEASYSEIQKLRQENAELLADLNVAREGLAIGNRLIEELQVWNRLMAAELAETKAELGKSRQKYDMAKLIIRARGRRP